MARVRICRESRAELISWRFAARLSRAKTPNLFRGTCKNEPLRTLVVRHGSVVVARSAGALAPSRGRRAVRSRGGDRSCPPAFALSSVIVFEAKTRPGLTRLQRIFRHWRPG